MCRIYQRVVRHLGHRLGSGLIHGLGVGALACSDKDFLHLLRVSHPEVGHAVVQVHQELRPPQVVDGGDEGKMNHSFIVESAAEISIGLVAQPLFPEPNTDQPGME